ncbi:MAG: type 1 glutamine amidotransferase [Sciscionella sp.]|nr:type 1 glutamine amidotransferase [Sciscionella sp.]
MAEAARARLLLIQPSEMDPPGPLADWLAEAGARIEHVRPEREPLPDLDGYQGVICLGGPMRTHDDAAHPWLADLRALLAGAVTDAVPTLTICLGAQLLAVSVGGRVRPMPAGPEVGTLLVAKRDAAAGDPLFADAPFMPDVVQFHTDEVHVLPPNSELLAASLRCSNQAFRIGNCAYGVQFHIETTPELVLDWARTNPDMAELVAEAQFDEQHLIDAHAEIAETWRPFAHRFVELASGERAPISPARSLPLA